MEKTSQSDQNRYNSRIISGRGLSWGKFPFVVRIEIEKASRYCGGSIIDKNWILTAAHCVKDKDGDHYSPLTIHIGAHNRTEKDGETVVIKTV